MNQTGVTSTGSRRQAFRNRLKAQGTRLRGSPPAPLFADRDFEQLARERDQLLEPERLVTQLRAQLPNLVRLRIVEIVIAGDDGDRRAGEPRDGADGAEELQAARQRHAEVEDHRLRTVRLRKAQPFVGGQGRPHLVALETKHSRKRVRDADIIIDNEHAGSTFGLGLGRSHRGHYAIFSHFGRRISPRNVQWCTRVGGCVSPILVRPVREQLEHDRIIRLLQAKYKRKFEVAINPGNEQTAPVGGPPPWYPDLVLQDARGKKLLGVVEVETAESVNHLEAMSQWAAFSRLRTPFHLYVPVSMIDVARRLAQDMQIPVAEVWAYSTLGDQLRFTLVQKSASTPEGRPRPAAAAPKPAVAPVRSAGNGQAKAKKPVAAAPRKKAV